MPNNLLHSLLLVDLSGSLIIAAIIVLLCAAIATTFALRGRYRQIGVELGSGFQREAVYKFRVLNRVFADANEAARSGAAEINAQAMVEQAFQLELRGPLTGERFVKASTGLLIILGLVGTFYGLTHSIGKLALLISGDFGQEAEVTTSLTRGLTEALAGMSVAFTTSLFGILAAIVMTFVGVFADPAERRTALMVRLETEVDRWVAELRGGADGAGAGFPAAVEQLETTVQRFESALSEFAVSTRGFQEFNLHLKDNVQRLSLCFADLSDTLKEQAGLMRGAPQRRAEPRPSIPAQPLRGEKPKP